MGMNVIPLKDLTLDKQKVVTLDVLKNMDPHDVQNEKPCGQIVVEVVYKPFQDDEIEKDIDDPKLFDNIKYFHYQWHVRRVMGFLDEQLNLNLGSDR